MKLLISTGILIFSLFLPFVHANPAKKIYQIGKTSEKIKIDGYIDEKAWDKALIVPVNIEMMPGENIPAPVKTKCLMLYDDSTIYVAFKAYDPEPQNIRAHLADRDTTWDDDLVAIVLDTFNDNNRAFAFFCNPLGVQVDEIISDGGAREDDSWDAIWRSGGHINENGYEVEMAIPFRALQFQRSPGPQTWGFAPLRFYPRSQIHRIVNFKFNRSNSCLLCQFHKMTGISGVAPGKNIELDPTLTAYRTDQRKNFPNGPMEKEHSNMEVGISGRWGFTPNMTLSATINPDFSQVEADAVQLDINTLFPLFYSEKRPFFLEGQDFFTTHIDAVYTRTLADPSWGVKVSGKEKKNAVGFFVARDEKTYLVFPGSESSVTTTLDQGSTSSVLRYRRDIGSSSTIGLLVTNREGGDYYNRLGGLDGLIRLSKSDTFRFQVLGSSSRYPDEIAQAYGQDTGTLGGYAMDFSFNREKSNYKLRAQYLDFSSEFRADMGFVPQVDYRLGSLGASYVSWGKEKSFFSHLEVGGDVDIVYDRQGNLLERQAQLNLLMEMPSMSLLSVTGGIRRKVFNFVEFDQKYLESYFRIRPSGHLSFQLSFVVCDDIDYQHTRAGKYIEVTPEINFYMGKHLYFSAAYLFTRLNVDEGQLYRANLAQTRLIYYFNKRAFLRAFLQYYDVHQNPDLYSYTVSPEYKWLFTQFLFSYKLNPRTVLFLGYSDNHYGNQDLNLKQRNRTFFLKIGYALSL